VRYALQGIDGAGAPTSEWEVGSGVYSAANTITRSTVLASSNADALVNLSAGTKHIWINFDATHVAWIRERLYANRTYYVRADGSDSNSGLANTAAGAFLTIQKAIDVVAETLDLGAYVVTIQLDDRTTTAPLTLKRLVSSGASGQAIIQGNSGTPANVVISTTSANAIAALGVGAGWLLKDFKVQTTTSGAGLQVSQFSYVEINNLVFGACASSHIRSYMYGHVVATGNYAISGGAPYHWLTSQFGRVNVASRTVTITGTPAFSGGFASASDQALISCSGNTFSGSATGKRYTGVTSGGIINSAGATLPGDTAGDTPTTNGQYI
jgi:hypothetical protein